MEKINWADVKEWDKKYYLHVDSTEEEYQHIPVERTEGGYLYFPDGSRVLDFMSQLYCVNMGQGHPKIQEAIRKATYRYGYLHEGFCTDYRARASKLIIEDLLGPDEWAGRMRFASSGSEANEMAIILAKLYTNRPNIITRQYAYHGFSMAAGVGGNGIRVMRSPLVSAKEIRDTPGGQTSGFHMAPAPYCFRCFVGLQYPDCKMANGKLPCVNATEELIKGLGAETVAAMITEPIYGGSSIVPPPEYLPQIREMTQKHNILWIDDEVMTGFGRTGRWFAYQHYQNVLPDIMTVAKGITSSALPCAGVILSKKLADFFEKYRWWTAATFSGHPLAVAAVVANVEAMMEENILENVNQVGTYLGEKLKELQSNHKCVGLVNGSGLFWIMEIVKNKETKEAFVKEDRFDMMTGDMSSYPSRYITTKCLEKGVLIGGMVPNTLRIGPALTTTREQINMAVEALDYALTELDKKCI